MPSTEYPAFHPSLADSNPKDAAAGSASVARRPGGARLSRRGDACPGFPAPVACRCLRCSRGLTADGRHPRPVPPSAKPGCPRPSQGYPAHSPGQCPVGRKYAGLTKNIAPRPWRTRPRRWQQRFCENKRNRPENGGWPGQTGGGGFVKTFFKIAGWMLAALAGLFVWHAFPDIQPIVTWGILAAFIYHVVSTIVRDTNSLTFDMRARSTPPSWTILTERFRQSFAMRLSAADPDINRCSTEIFD